MDDFDEFYLYLMKVLPPKVSIGNLEDICFALFCTMDILPEKLQSMTLTKEKLAKVFSLVAHEKNESDNLMKGEQDKSLFLMEEHWVDMIGAKMVSGEIPNMEGIAKLLENREV